MAESTPKMVFIAIKAQRHKVIVVSQFSDATGKYHFMNTQIPSK